MTPAVPTASPTAQPLTFREHAEAWFARESAGMKRATRAVYATVHRDLIELFGPIGITDLARNTIRAGFDLLAARGLSPSTRIRYRAVLSRILEDARDRELVTENVVLGVRPPRARRVREIVVPTAAELARVLAVLPRVVPPEREMLFRILDATAIRVGECQVLRPADYEPATQRLRVGRTIYRGTLAPGETRDDTPKSNVERWVDVPDSLARDLPGFLACRGAADWMFPGRFGAQPITYAPLREDTVRIADAAGVPGMTAHSFRHARLSLWVAGGADLEWVRRQAGHHSIAFTIARYGAHMKMRDQAVLRDLPPARRDGTDENPPMP